jgi:peptidoglycan hydrolase-like protein with peptidoglycan-binding domain
MSLPASSARPAVLVSGMVFLLLGLVLAAGLAAPAVAAPGSPGARAAEERLAALHCDPGPADGHVDAHTRSALVRFQTRHGLAVTRRLDRETRRLLRSDAGHRCDPRPVPSGTGKGRRIVASQRQNWVWLVGPRGGVVAQGGMVDNPSALRPGSYVTGSYCGRAARIKLNQTTSGTVWLDNFVRFAPCGFGFHRIPRDKSTGAQVHPDWYLGTDLDRSHGCLRLSRAMSLRVWRFTATGRTRVRVV